MKGERLPNDAGAALIMVLSMIAMLSMIAIVAVDMSMTGMRRTGNSVGQTQARWYVNGAEAFAAGRIRDIRQAMAEGRIDQADWQGRQFSFPLDDGVLTLTLFDGSNCFNLNSLVSLDEGGGTTSNAAAQVQLARLLDLVGVRSDSAAGLVAALTDWIDPDSIPAPGGGEDEVYGGPDARYRVANAPLVDLAELSRVRGFTPDAVAKLRPFVCVRPTSMSMVLNPNTLTPDQGVLLSSVFGQILPRATAEALIRGRPRNGWPSVTALLAEPALVQAGLGGGSSALFSLETRYFVVMTTVQNQSAQETGAALLDAAQNGRVIRRLYGVSGKDRAL